MKTINSRRTNAETEVDLCVRTNACGHTGSF
jgi:hypothetical protein